MADISSRSRTTWLPRTRTQRSISKRYLEARFIGVEFRVEPQTRFECKRASTRGSEAHLHQITLAAQQWLGKY